MTFAPACARTVSNPRASIQEVDPVRYVSTRGQAPVLSFTDALLAGLARDGGLYVPEAVPAMSRDQIEKYVWPDPLPDDAAALTRGDAE